MLDKAVEKIKKEMDQSKNNPYVQVVGGFLLQYLSTHPAVAEKLLQEGKTILKSLDEMKKAAAKKQVGRCAVLTDQEGFAIVLNYFGIETQEIKYAPVTADNFEAKKTPEVKPNKDIDFDVSLDDFLR